MIAAEADAVAWMPLKLAGARACFGPTLGPGLPGSRAGLLAALRAGRPVEQWLESHAGRPFGTATPRTPQTGGKALAAALVGAAG